MRLVFGRRELWRFVWQPMFISALIFIAILFVGYWLLVPRITDIVEGWGVSGAVGAVSGTVLYAVFWFFAAGVVYLALTGLLSSFLWEKLSLKAEEMARGSAPNPKLSSTTIVTDTVLRAGFSAFICCGTLACFWFPIGAVVLAAWLSLYDFTANAYLRRSVAFPAQAGRAFKCKHWWDFALICGLLTLVPMLNVVLLPALVAGGTLMVADSEAL